MSTKKKRKVFSNEEPVSHFSVGGLSFHLPSHAGILDEDISSLLNTIKRKFFANDDFNKIQEDIKFFLQSSFTYLRLPYNPPFLPTSSPLPQLSNKAQSPPKPPAKSHARENNTSTHVGPQASVGAMDTINSLDTHNMHNTQDVYMQDARAQASPGQAIFCEVLCKHVTNFLVSLGGAVRERAVHKYETDIDSDRVQFYFNTQEEVLDGLLVEDIAFKYPPLPNLVATQTKGIISSLICLLLNDNQDLQQYRLTVSDGAIGDQKCYIIIRKLVLALEVVGASFWEIFNAVITDASSDNTADIKQLLSPWLVLYLIARVIPNSNWKHIPLLFDSTMAKAETHYQRETRKTPSNSLVRSCMMRMCHILKKLTALWAYEEKNTALAFHKFWQYFNKDGLAVTTVTPTVSHQFLNSNEDEFALFLQALDQLLVTKAHSPAISQETQHQAIDLTLSHFNQLTQLGQQLQQQAQQMYNKFFITLPESRIAVDEKLASFKAQLAPSAEVSIPEGEPISLHALRNSLSLLIVLCRFVPTKLLFSMVTRLSGVLNLAVPGTSLESRVILLDSLFLFLSTLQKRECTNEIMKADLQKASKECIAQINAVMQLIWDDYILFKKELSNPTRPPVPVPVPSTPPRPPASSTPPRPPAPSSPPTAKPPLPTTPKATSFFDKYGSNNNNNPSPLKPAAPPITRPVQPSASQPVTQSSNTINIKPKQGLGVLSRKNALAPDPPPPSRPLYKPPPTQSVLQKPPVQIEDNDDTDMEDVPNKKFAETRKREYLTAFAPKLESTLLYCLAQYQTIMQYKPLDNHLLDESYPFWECKLIDYSVTQALSTKNTLVSIPLRQTAMNIVRATLERLKYDRTFGEPEKWLQQEARDRLWQSIRDNAAAALRPSASPNERIHYTIDAIAEMAPLVAPVMKNLWEALVDMYGPKSFILDNPNKEIRAITFQFFKRAAEVFPDFVVQHKWAVLQMWILSLVDQPLKEKVSSFTNCLWLTPISSNPLLNRMRLNRPPSKVLATLTRNLTHASDNQESLVPQCFSSFLKRKFSEIVDDQSVDVHTRAAHVRSIYKFVCGLFANCSTSLLLHRGLGKSLFEDLAYTCFPPASALIDISLDHLHLFFKSLSTLSFQTPSAVQAILGHTFVSYLSPSPPVTTLFSTPLTTEKRIRALAQALKEPNDAQFTVFRRFVIWNCCGYLLEFIATPSTRLLIFPAMSMLVDMVNRYTDATMLVADFTDFLWLCLQHLQNQNMLFAPEANPKSHVYTFAKAVLDKLSSLDYFKVKCDLTDLFKGIAFQAGYDLYAEHSHLLLFAQKLLTPQQVSILPHISTFMADQMSRPINAMQNTTQLVPSIFSFFQAMCESGSDTLRFYLIDLFSRMKADLLDGHLYPDNGHMNLPIHTMYPYIPLFHNHLLQPHGPPSAALRAATVQGIKQVSHALGGSWAILHGGMDLPLL